MNSVAGTNKLPFKFTSFDLTYQNNCFRFAMPADPDAVIGTISENEHTDDRHLPYWAENWPSTVPFFHFIQKQHFPDGLSIGELGCGVGVLSSCLSNRHLFTVAMDISPAGCRFASYNISQNNGIPRVVCADWRFLPVKTKFDLLIASDVLYEERLISVIIDTIEQLLVPGGAAWIADPCRRYWKSFKEESVFRGFSLRLIHSQTIPLSAVTVEIVELRKSVIDRQE
jgi:predicted nicotinamide N-methyase